jgi:lipoprotein signal peptidase
MVNVAFLALRIPHGVIDSTEFKLLNVADISIEVSKVIYIMKSLLTCRAIVETKPALYIY